jgi:hypothetical protein
MQTSENCTLETVRKGFERCSNREFGRYAEHEIGQKRASRQPVGLRHECVQDFSDSFSRQQGE